MMIFSHKNHTPADIFAGCLSPCADKASAYLHPELENPREQRETRKKIPQAFCIRPDGASSKTAKGERVVWHASAVELATFLGRSLSQNKNPFFCQRIQSCRILFWSSKKHQFCNISEKQDALEDEERRLSVEAQEEEKYENKKVSWYFEPLQKGLNIKTLLSKNKLYDRKTYLFGGNTPLKKQIGKAPPLRKTAHLEEEFCIRGAPLMMSATGKNRGLKGKYPSYMYKVFHALKIQNDPNSWFFKGLFQGNEHKRQRILHPFFSPYFSTHVCLIILWCIFSLSNRILEKPYA